MIALQKTPEEQARLFKDFQIEYSNQVAQNGNPMRTALVLPGTMIGNGFIFLSIFGGVSKLMAAKVRACYLPHALWGRTRFLGSTWAFH
jgi:YidC/Oxa1 family membrane protein insertase